MPHFNINTGSIQEHAAKLEKMHKSAFPLAIRGTLNAAAVDVKKNTLPKYAQRAFVTRNKSFWRAFSRFELARGFTVRTMEAKAGMTDRRFGGTSEQAGRNMTERQIGGSIGGRSLIPLDTARTSKKNNRNVRKDMRISSLENELANMVDTRKSKGKSRKQRFVRSAVYQAKNRGHGSLIKHQGDDGKTRIYRVGSVGSRVRNRELFIKVLPIYTYEPGREVQAGKTNRFTLNAALETQKKMDRIFIEQAERQFKRLRK